MTRTSHHRAGPIPEPGDRGVPRYSVRPFPPYRYVPGLHPHPLRDPAGHSYRAHFRLDRHPPWSPEHWRRIEDWLYGVDLLNRFYFWEAHEAWEGLWASCERQSAPGLLLQGLIQIAAALLKAHVRALEGARMLSTEGLAKLGRVGATHPVLLGLELTPLCTVWTDYFAPLQRGELVTIGPAVPVLRLAMG
jgi:hypothetical protein